MGRVLRLSVILIEAERVGYAQFVSREINGILRAIRPGEVFGGFCLSGDVFLASFGNFYRQFWCTKFCHLSGNPAFAIYAEHFWSATSVFVVVVSSRKRCIMSETVLLGFVNTAATSRQDLPSDDCLFSFAFYSNLTAFL